MTHDTRSTRPASASDAEIQEPYRANGFFGSVSLLRLLCILIWFAVQPLLVVAVCILALGSPRDLQDEWHRFAGQPGTTIAEVLAASTFMALIQGAMLMPVFPPRAARGRPSLFRCLVTGAGVGCCISFPLVVFLHIVRWMPSFPQIEGEIEFFVAVVLAGVLIGLPIAWRLHVSRRDGIPLRISLLAAGWIAAMLAVGVVYGLMQAQDLLLRGVMPGAHSLRDETKIGIGIVTLFSSWALFTPIVLRFRRGVDDSTFAGRVINGLFLGTIVELLVTIPVDAMARRRIDCHCSGTSFWSLVIGISAGFITIGPIVLLLPVGRRLNRRHIGRCGACGYDMRNTPGAARCPECGAGWRTPAASDAATVND